jgi:ketosteroid isomerase-like protein
MVMSDGRMSPANKEQQPWTNFSPPPTASMSFLSDGVLAGFWGEATGPEQIGAAFDFMLATFARGRRHVVTNHEVTVTGDSATMFSVMTVQDRTTNATIGTAAFTDTLARDGDGWRFVRRTLAADPNVQPIIDGLMAHQAA